VDEALLRESSATASCTRRLPACSSFLRAAAVALGGVDAARRGVVETALWRPGVAVEAALRRAGGGGPAGAPEPARRGGRRVGRTLPRRGSAARRRGGGGRPGVAVPPATPRAGLHAGSRWGHGPPWGRGGVPPR